MRDGAISVSAALIADIYRKEDETVAFDLRWMKMKEEKKNGI